MRTGLIAKKVGMSSLFTESGERISVTLLRIEKCQVVGHRTSEKNGYNALIMGGFTPKINNITKPMKHFFEKAKVEPSRVLREFRIDNDNFIDVGCELKADHYKVGQYIDVSGRSLGKGFSGVMKRYNFAGLEATHGVSVSHRSHGSTGQCQDPGRVFKGKKMAGQYGNVNKTIQNLRIIDINLEDNLIIVKGSIPGHKDSYVYISDAVKKTVSI